MMMKKYLLAAILVICIMLSIFGLTCCDKFDVSDSSKNDVTNEANIPVTVMPTQPNPSRDKEIDYDQIIKKVWIAENWDKEKAYEYSSFCISKIENGLIEGKYTVRGVAEPYENYYLPNHLWDFTGTMNNGSAECQIIDRDGNDAKMKLIFITNNEIEATIEYASKSEFNGNKYLNGTFFFRPYNLKDISGFTPFCDQCFAVDDLNSWGDINFVSGKRVRGHHIPTVAYLANKGGDIFYSFTSLLPNNVNIKAVSFQDLNKDGLKDIIIIIGGVDDSLNFALVTIQDTYGSFSRDSKFEQGINESGNNKDIQTIMDYLSNN